MLVTPHKDELELAGAVSNCVGQNGTTNWWYPPLATCGTSSLVLQICQYHPYFSHDVGKPAIAFINI